MASWVSFGVLLSHLIMAPRPSSKKWGEKKINADTRDSPIEMHVVVPNCGNFFFLPFLLIFKDLINQNESQHASKTNPKETWGRKRPLGIIFQRLSWGPRMLPPLKRRWQEKPHWLRPLGAPPRPPPAPYGLRKLPQLQTNFLRKIALAKALPKTKHHGHGRQEHQLTPSRHYRTPCLIMKRHN